METFDAITLLTAGIALGIIVGHWLGKADQRLEYERGKLDGINTLWPHLVRAWTNELLASRSKPTGDASTGRDGGAQ